MKYSDLSFIIVINILSRSILHVLKLTNNLSTVTLTLKYNAIGGFLADTTNGISKTAIQNCHPDISIDHSSHTLYFFCVLCLVYHNFTLVCLS